MPKFIIYFQIAFQLLLTGILTFISSDIFAQAPQRFNYQAVLRNASNALLSNQNVGLRISILKDSPSLSPVYVELHSVSTSSSGLISLEIGSGKVVSGSISTINWGSGKYYIKTESDPLGGTNYSLSATMQLLSVPYALNASFSDNGLKKGSVLNQIMYWNGSEWVALNPGGDGQVLTICNGMLKWTTGGQCVGSIAELKCSEVSNTGVLTQGKAASNVSFSIPYTGGNGGTYEAQSINSTSVNGLTASISTSTFSNGSGTITYNVSGTPSSSGTATFVINIGGKSCTINITVLGSGTVGNSTASCGAPNLHNPAISYGTMTDQNGNVYKTVVIGTQEWMAENLVVSNYRNGDPIPIVTNYSTWASLNTGAACWFNNDSLTYHCPYGKLYNAYVVNDPRKVCPTGWHVPTESEWSILENHLGGSNIAGGKMKAIGTQYWIFGNAAANNASGFSAVGSEYRDNYGSWGPNTKANINNLYWLSTTQGNANSARRISYEVAFISSENQTLNHGFSIRCIKD